MDWTCRDVTRRHLLYGLSSSLSCGLSASLIAGPARAKPDPKPDPKPFDLTAAPLHVRGSGDPAPAGARLAYNHQVPGPLIRVKLGDEVFVRLSNQLDQPTSLTWHGVRNINAMDGVAGLTQPPVPPGGSFTYRFTPPDAGLYWYHPSVFPQGPAQTAQGLYGVLLVEATNRPSVDLDLLLVIAEAGGAPGEPMMAVNGRPLPLAPIALRPGSRVRIGLLNLCDMRLAFVGFAHLAPLVIAIDGQPSELFPPATGTLPIGPGARFEVLVDMPDASSPPPRLVLRSESGTAQDLVTFQIGGPRLPTRPAATRLAPNPRLPTRIPLERSLRVTLEIARAAAPAKNRTGQTGEPASPGWAWTLNGRSSDGRSGPPLFRVRRNHPVTLTLANKSDVAQEIHLHGHVFRILHDLDDGWDPYWRESILLGPGKTKHIAFIADNPGRWLLASGFGSRQVMGLAGWFEVV